MKQKKPFTSLPEFTDLSYEDKLVHYMLLREDPATNEQTQLACLTILRKTFQGQIPKPKKD